MNSEITPPSETIKLNQKYSFWFRIFDEVLLGKEQMSKMEYENQVKKIAEFDNVTFLTKKFRLINFGKFFSILENQTAVNQE